MADILLVIELYASLLSTFCVL